MGKHSAAAHAAPAREAAPLPAVLAQTAAFGALAIVVAVVALTWAGVGGREAALVGIGLLLVGVVGFFVVRRTGLLRDTSPEADEQAASNGHI